MLGIIGEPRVNVLQLNLALDAPEGLTMAHGRARTAILKTAPIPTRFWRLRAGDGRGKLTLFLGAAPGVGKTYAMLARARRLKADRHRHRRRPGRDAWPQRDGRSCSTGWRCCRAAQVDYQGRTIEEFDLDAALARRPRIIVVDELAHTNAPDSRHPKRYQDVEELIAAGIDVWSAMNIQHLESLSDVVAADHRRAGPRTRTGYGAAARADDVQLVDLAPAELIERLKEGKVYLPENARRAADSFFRLGNLTALRELALRRTADRVDDQMVDYLKQNAIEGPWQTAERLLVCIGPDTLSEKVVRTAARLASGLNAPWLVVSIERADRPSASAEAMQRLEATFKLAESLGAETRRVIGNDFVEEILKTGTARTCHADRHRRAVASRFPCVSGTTNRCRTRLLRARLGLGIHIVTADRQLADTRTAPSARKGVDHKSNSSNWACPIVSVAVATGSGPRDRGDSSICRMSRCSIC